MTSIYEEQEYSEHGMVNKMLVTNGVNNIQIKIIQHVCISAFQPTSNTQHFTITSILIYFRMLFERFLINTAIEKRVYTPMTSFSDPGFYTKMNQR